MLKVTEIKAKGVLNKSRIFDYCINPYTGCQINCRYCYARLFMGRYSGHSEQWGEFVDVKVNAPEVLRRQLDKAKKGTVWISSVCDPYQPLEAKYELTRGCLKELARKQFPVNIQTKSKLVLRDLDLLQEFEEIEVGFTITTEACLNYFVKPEKTMEELKPIVLQHIEELENITNRKFSDQKNPLLVSVRSGAPMSMPGMMDTVLNLGLNDHSVGGVATQTENPRFAYDSYRRFIQMFGDVVMGIGDEKFERILNKYKRMKGRSAQDTDLEVIDLQKIIADYKALYEKEIGEKFPQDPFDQLFLAIEAVFTYCPLAPLGFAFITASTTAVRLSISLSSSKLTLPRGT